MSKSQKKGNKAKRKKLFIVLAVEFFVLIALIGGYAIYYVNHSLDLLQTDDTVKKEDIVVSDAVTETMSEKYQTIVLYGVDTRETADMTKPGVARSDAVIIASINNETKEVKLVSVYRDAFLEMANDSQSTQKYTHAYFFGGPVCAMETLNKNLDLNITDYVAVDFKALTNAIDALGGITVNVKSNELNNLNKNLQEQIEVTGIYSEGVWDSGDVLLNGSQATAYARIRKVGNGDFERTQRQRAVVSAMIKKAKQSDLATINNLISEIFPQIATNMTKKQLISLASDLFDYELGDNIGFPLANETPTLGDKGSVVVPADLLSNVKHLHEFLYPEDTDYAPSEEVKRISAKISNETGIYDEFTEDKKTEEPTQTNSAGK